MLAKKLISNLIGFCICFGAVAPMNSTLHSVWKSSGKGTRLQKLSDFSIDGGSHELQFINEQEGWLVSRKSLWRTTDGGRSWKLLYEGETSWDISATIDNLQFINSQIGWISVSPEGLYKTEDGGSTWKLQTQPFDGVIYSVKFFKDGKQGWAAGEVLRPSPKKYRNRTARPDSYAVISHTADGGITWRGQVMPGTRGILDLYFLDEEHAWALGAPGLFFLESKSNRWRAVDFYKGGCVNQLLLKTLNPTNLVQKPVALYFLDSNLGWLSFEYGYVAKTTDGGRTWCDLLNPRDVWPDPIGLPYFWRIYFIDSKRGWAVGYSSLYETKDGGVRWSKIDIEAEFKNIYFLDHDHGWAVAKEGIYSISP